MIADALIGTTLTLVGIPDLVALPWWQSLAIFGYAMVACLGVNDSLKVAMIKWRVPVSVAWNPGDLIRPSERIKETRGNIVMKNRIFLDPI